MSAEHRKRELVALVLELTQERLHRSERRHASCVAPGVGPLALAQKLRADRLPPDAELRSFATRLVEWALGVDGATKPYLEDDLEKGG